MKRKSKWIMRGGTAVVAAAILWSNAPVAIQPLVANAASAEKSLSSQVVKLSSQSTLSIRDVNFLMQDKGKVLSFTVNITNDGSKEIDLMDYWLKIKTKSGKSFKAVVRESDKEIKTIAPKTSQYITYYAVVDNATSLKDLMFEIIKWDFSVSNYERVLGTIKASSNETNRVAAFKDKVMIVNNAKVRSAIKQAFVTKDQSYGYITINYLVENVGLKPTDLTKTAFYIQTQSNSVYKVSAPDVETMTLQPNERQIITLTVKVPVAVAGKPLSLVMAQNDEASKVLLASGEFLLPSLSTTPVTAVGKERSIYLAGKPVTTSVGRASLEDKGDEAGLSVDFNLVNKGSEAITTPEFEVFIRTKSNVNYPLTYTKDETKLLPGIKKTITLTGDIPTSVKVEEAEIVVRAVSTEKTPGYVIGTYKTTSSAQQGSLASSFQLDKYTIKLNTIQRSPLEDADMLVADLSITNNDTISRKVPSLSGYFLVNGVKVESDATAVALDDAITIAPGETYNMVVYSKIPYSTTVSKIAFAAVEPVKDKAPKVLYQFTGQSLSSIPVYAKDRAYEITNVGKKSSIKLVRNAIFSGTANNQFYAEFAVENKEARLATLSKLGGYLMDANGQVVPVSFATLKSKVLPNGKVLLSAWATLPNQFKSESYKLYIGQALSAGTGGATTGGEAGATESSTASAVVKMVAYQLDGAGSAVQTGLDKLQLAGHNLSLTKLYAQLKVTGSFDVEGINLKMNYSLEKDPQYDYVAGDHKITVEFVNNDSLKATYAKSFALAAAEGSQDEVLKTGTFIPLSITFSDNAVQSKISDYKTYTVNIYDEFQGTKLLIATKQLNWFQEQ